MPSKSQSQSKLMTAACKNAKFRKKVGIPKKVACDFHSADRGKYHEENEMGELNRIRELAGLMSEVGHVDDDQPDTRSPIDAAADTLADLIDAGAKKHGAKFRVNDAFRQLKNAPEFARLSPKQIADKFFELYVASPQDYLDNAIEDVEYELTNPQKFKTPVRDEFNPIEEKFQAPKVKDNDDVPDANEIPHLMKMAGIKKKLEDEKDGEGVPNSIGGILTSVARGTLKVNDKGKVGESSLSFIKTLNSELSPIKILGETDENTEDDGDDGDEEVDENRQSTMFPKESLDRIIVEVIVDEIKKGKTSKEISEELAFNHDDVEYICKWVKSRK